MGNMMRSLTSGLELNKTSVELRCVAKRYASFFTFGMIISFNTISCIRDIDPSFNGDRGQDIKRSLVG